MSDNTLPGFQYQGQGNYWIKGVENLMTVVVAPQGQTWAVTVGSGSPGRSGSVLHYDSGFDTPRRAAIAGLLKANELLQQASATVRNTHYGLFPLERE
jgi:hypothetical protein